MVVAAGNLRWPSLSRGKSLMLLAACLGIAAGAAVRNLAWYPLHVASDSMFPTVAAGDWVVISPQHAAVQRGDIVLFKFPFGTSGRAIKRVIAVPGDRVEAEGNNVRVNAEAAAEATAIPEGYYFILGDNVASSVDSRSLGLLPETDVLGKVSAVIRKPW